MVVGLKDKEGGYDLMMLSCHCFQLAYNSKCPEFWRVSSGITFDDEKFFCIMILLKSSRKRGYSPLEAKALDLVQVAECLKTPLPCLSNT
ncbi:hypothetical protein TNCV_2529361 [Trichonephila clavipes]|nr:hypothetical protein TNCV_2529361 [Trichonephila clavipes]